MNKNNRHPGPGPRAPFAIGARKAPDILRPSKSPTSLNMMFDYLILTIVLSFLAYPISGQVNEVVTIPQLQVKSVNDKDGVGAGSSCYTTYTGDGSVAQGWPSYYSWASFANMWQANLPNMQISCEWMGFQDDSATELADIQQAIEEIAVTTNVDHRFILAIILQESNGCVREVVTNNAVRNPGLMQSHNGNYDCNENYLGHYNSEVDTPCPDNKIYGMIEDGTAGTASGAGLAGVLNAQGRTDVSGYYRAARLYNSGSIDDANLNDPITATACYVNDIANRLTGWAGGSTPCTLTKKKRSTTAKDQSAVLNNQTKTVSSAPADACPPLSTITPQPTSAPAPSQWWYANVAHNGLSAFTTNPSTYTVWRDVVATYGADNTGSSDASAAIQNAINDGARTAATNGGHGTTTQPAMIYLAPGTYRFDNSIQLFLGTVLVGDASNPPTIKASSTFSGSTIIYAKDPNQVPQNNFYIGVKNLIIDSNSISPSTAITLLNWPVSQATQLTNVVFNMPSYSTGHVGIDMNPPGSACFIGDLTFNGGYVGIIVSTQQLEIKTATFNGCTTGISIGYCWDCVFSNMNFMNAATGIDMTAGSVGSVVLLDSTGTNMGPIVNTNSETTGDHSLILQNVVFGSGTSAVVQASGTSILTATVPSASVWIYGNAFTPNGPYTGAHQTGTLYSAPRSSSLISNGAFISLPPPAYISYTSTQVVNVKSVSNYPVHGDGNTDDTANLQHIINAYAGSKLLYFPAGTYIISNTITIPPGTRAVGDAFGSMLSATGSKFQNANAPIPMLLIGTPGSTGIAQFTDLIFTVAQMAPGCILVEVNMAGNNPGDVGFWNSHFRVGGAADTSISTTCSGSAANCMAAFAMLHLKTTSSAYVENMWGWTADHNLDGGPGQNIATGRGCLVEATKATWLHGVAFEHNTLYQFNFHGAQNVFMGMHQSETPYWQGPGQSVLAPAPWTPSTTYGDPDFSNCNGSDASCRMAWFNYITNSANLYFHGAGFWAFSNAGSVYNGGSCQGTSPFGTICQSNAVWVSNTVGLYYYAIQTFQVTTLVWNGGSALALLQNNPGGWQGLVAAFLTDAQGGNPNPPHPSSTTLKTTTSKASISSSKTSTSRTSITAPSSTKTSSSASKNTSSTIKPTSTSRSTTSGKSSSSTKSTSSVKTSSSTKASSSSKVTTTATTITTSSKTPSSISNTSKASSTAIATPSPTAGPMPANCNKFYLCKSGDTCTIIANAYGLTVAAFEKYNSVINSECTNLVPNYYYCIGVAKAQVQAQAVSSTLFTVATVKDVSSVA